MVIIEEPRESQRCRIHDDVWVSLPRPYVDGTVIHLTWSDVSGRVLDRYDLALSQAQLHTRSSGYLLPED